METIYFYIFSIMLLFSSAAVIFAPRMFLALFGLFLSCLFTALVCWRLNADFIAIFEFVLCGIVLCPVIFLLMNKISRWNLPLKLVPPLKIITATIVSVLFCIIAVLFIKEEFTTSLFYIFNYINEKSFDSVKFFSFAFPLHLICIVLVAAFIVIRAIVRPDKEEEEASNGR